MLQREAFTAQMGKNEFKTTTEELFRKAPIKNDVNSSILRSIMK